MITTYAELQAAVADRSHRHDLAARIPDFIRNAELEINRRLTIFPMEVEVPLVLGAGSRFIDLPADYGSPIGMSRTSEGRDDLVMTTAAQLPVSADPGTPAYWAVDGMKLAFDKPAAAVFPVAFRYLKSVFLSDSNPTNDVFARAPDMYLYGALAELADWCRDDRGVSVYTAKFKSLLRDVAADAARSKGAAPLQTEIPASLLCSSSTRRNWGH